MLRERLVSLREQRDRAMSDLMARNRPARARGLSLDEFKENTVTQRLKALRPLEAEIKEALDTGLATGKWDFPKLKMLRERLTKLQKLRERAQRIESQRRDCRMCGVSYHPKQAHACKESGNVHQTMRDPQVAVP